MANRETGDIYKPKVYESPPEHYTSYVHVYENGRLKYIPVVRCTDPSRCDLLSCKLERNNATISPRSDKA